MAAQAARKMTEALARRIRPTFDRVLIEKAEAMAQTRGGIILPEKAKGKVLQGTVVAVGPGMRNENGQHIPVAMSVGDTVLLPEFGGSKVTVEEGERELYLFREHDILAKIQD